MKYFCEITAKRVEWTRLLEHIQLYLTLQNKQMDSF